MAAIATATACLHLPDASASTDLMVASAYFRAQRAAGAQVGGA